MLLAKKEKILAELNDESCKAKQYTAEQRFRLVVQVQDKTATTTFTLFNKEAEQIVGIPLRKILADMDEAAPIAAPPPPINNIIGKECIFQLKVTQYNMKHGCEEYTVTRVSEAPSMESDVAEKSAAAHKNTELSATPTKKQKIA